MFREVTGNMVMSVTIYIYEQRMENWTKDSGVRRSIVKPGFISILQGGTGGTI